MTVQKDTPFGVQLRQYRTVLGLTQEELAELARLSPRGIRALERGERTAPRRETVNLLADALQLGDEDRRIFQAAARVAPLTQPVEPTVPHPTSSLPRWSMGRSIPLRGVALVMLILLISSVSLGTHTLIHGAHSERVIGAVVPHWPAPAERQWPMSDPVAMATDTGGELYALDAHNNLIHAFASDGTPLFTWGGTGTGRGELLAPSAIAVTASGTVYVADTGNNRVQVFSSTGAWKATWSGPAAGLHFTGPAGLAVGPGGDVYVSDTGNNRIEVFSSTGQVITEWSDQALHAPTGITVDPAGDVYVLNQAGASIRKYSPEGDLLGIWPGPTRAPISITADSHGTIWAASGSEIEGFSPQGRLVSRRRVTGVVAIQTATFDRRGTLYVAAVDHGVIEKVSPTGEIAARFDGSPDGSVVPGAVATDRLGNVYAATSGGRVQVFSPDGRLVHVWLVAGASTAAVPRAVAVDKRGTIVLVDGAADRLWRIAAAGKTVGQWDGHGTSGGRLNTPAGVAVDQEGHIYVAEAGAARIREFSSIGYQIKAWDLRTATGTGPGISPMGIGLDGHGDLFVADALSDRVIKLSQSGHIMGTWGTAGSAPGQFRSPEGIAISASGNLYVADAGNNRVQVLSPSGVVLQIIGRRGRRPGQFDRPSSIAVDPSDTAFVADTGNHRIERFRAPNV